MRDLYSLALWAEPCATVCMYVHTCTQTVAVFAFAHTFKARQTQFMNLKLFFQCNAQGLQEKDQQTENLKTELVIFHTQRHACTEEEGEKWIANTSNKYTVNMWTAPLLL